MLIFELLRDKQPDIAEMIETLWGPFTLPEPEPPQLTFGEWEKLMQEAPRPGRAGDADV